MAPAVGEGVVHYFELRVVVGWCVIRRMTKSEIEAGLNRTLEAMLEAGWLESFTFTEEKGFVPFWTPGGVDHARHLKALFGSLRLNADDRLPMAFCIFCQGAAPAVADWAGMPEEVRALVGQCAEALNLKDGDDYLFFVHTILMFGPDEKSEVRLAL